MAVSPAKFVRVEEDEEIEAIRKDLQLTSYASKDPAVSRENLYENVCHVHGKVMLLLKKKTRLLQAANKRAEMLQAEIGKLRREVVQLREELEVQGASSQFMKDEMRDGASQTMEEEDEEEEMKE